MKKYTAIIVMKVDVYTDQKAKVKGIIEEHVPYVGMYSGDVSIESRKTVDIIDIH